MSDTPRTSVTFRPPPEGPIADYLADAESRGVKTTTAVLNAMQLGIESGPALDAATVLKVCASARSELQKAFDAVSELEEVARLALQAGKKKPKKKATKKKAAGQGTVRRSKKA